MEKNKKQKVLFYYLSAFFQTGGIEKFNRCFIKALNEIGVDPASSIVSVYDGANNKNYNADLSFKGFDKKKLRSVLHVVKAALETDILVIGHINLAIAGWLVKVIHPGCKVIVIAHGIEVWQKLRFVKKWCLKSADSIMAVSTYTKNQLILKNGIKPGKIRLFPNTIDPYFKLPKHFDKPEYLLKRYGLSKEQPVILTLSRLSSSEKYKGYDAVISALSSVISRYSNVVYILAGKYDNDEKQRVDELIRVHGIEKNIILTGFLPEEEVVDHYLLANIFVMPSKGEGFGIVFIEALACGTSVVGGNQDGTVDALRNGTLGELINPNSSNDIAEAIIRKINEGNQDQALIQQKVLHQYQFSAYKSRLSKQLLTDAN